MLCNKRKIRSTNEGAWQRQEKSQETESSGGRVRKEEGANRRKRDINVVSDFRGNVDRNNFLNFPTDMARQRLGKIRG